MVATLPPSVRPARVPAGVLTDNGAVFTGEYRGHGEVALELLLRAHRVGLRPLPALPPADLRQGRAIPPDPEEMARRPPRRQDPARTAIPVDAFNRYYNTQRPHKALNRRTPAQSYAARPKATAHGPKIPAHYRLRRDVIDQSGTVTLRYNSRLHHIGLGRLAAGTRIYVLTDDLDIRIIKRDGQLIRELTLDPTRDYQPRGAKKGPQRPKNRE